MLIEVKIPVFPESVSEGMLLNWYKEPGDSVQQDESLIDLETDKAMMEITSPAAGIIKEIKLENNSKVHGGEIAAIIDATQKAETQASPDAVSEKTMAAPEKESNPLFVQTQVHAPAQEKPGREGTKEEGEKKDKKEITTISPDDRTSQESNGDRPWQRVPMTRLRMKIAERLKQAQSTAAILTTFNEINMKPVTDLRARYHDEFQQKHQVKLGFMSFFIKASVEALKKFPIVNASIDGGDIIYHGYFDLGIAVSSPRGLVVPVIQNADQMSFAGLETRIRDLGEKAKNAALSLEELTGGTFTITNGGVFGSLLSTPILNPPQSAILGMHNIQERPVVENGEIVARPMMYVALSYDHRIIDGREAVLFLKTIKEFLEDPARMLLQI